MQLFTCVLEHVFENNYLYHFRMHDGTHIKRRNYLEEEICRFVGGSNVAYRYVSRNVSFAPTYETMFSENHRKGWEVGLQYVPIKNIVADAFYFHGKKLDTGLNSKTIYGRVRWYF